MGNQCRIYAQKNNFENIENHKKRSARDKTIKKGTNMTILGKCCPNKLGSPLEDPPDPPSSPASSPAGHIKASLRFSFSNEISIFDRSKRNRHS